MTDSTPAKDAADRSWGEAIGTLPQVQELVEVRRALPPETSAEEVRRVIVETANRVRFSVLGIWLPMFAALSEEARATSLQEVLQRLLAQPVPQLEDMTLGDFLDKLSKVGGIEDWLVDYVERYAATGEPPAALSSWTGGVGTLPVGMPGEQLPIVYALITPLTPLTETLDRLKELCLTEFGSLPQMGPETIVDSAHAYRLYLEDMTNRQIAQELLGDRATSCLTRSTSTNCG